MKRRGYFYVALTSTFNIILYALTFGRFVWLEGRVSGGVFSNWAKRFRYRPRNFIQPIRIILTSIRQQIESTMLT